MDMDTKILTTINLTLRMCIMIHTDTRISSPIPQLSCQHQDRPHFLLNGLHQSLLRVLRPGPLLGPHLTQRRCLRRVQLLTLRLAPQQSNQLLVLQPQPPPHIQRAIRRENQVVLHRQHQRGNHRRHLPPSQAQNLPRHPRSARIQL